MAGGTCRGGGGGGARFPDHDGFAFHVISRGGEWAAEDADGAAGDGAPASG